MNPQRSAKRRQCGQALVEFTLVGIPLIFVLISVFEISRGMWVYHTLAHSVREGVRYASVHGNNCATNGNTCVVNMGPIGNTCNGSNTSVAEVIRCAAVGLDPATTQIKFYTFTLGNAKTLQGSCTLATGSCSGTQFPPLERIDRASIGLRSIFRRRSRRRLLCSGRARIRLASRAAH